MNWHQIELKREKYYKVFAQLWHNKLYKEAEPMLIALRTNPSSIYHITQINPNIDYTDLFVNTWTIPGTFFGKETRKQYAKSLIDIEKKDILDDYLKNELHRYALEEAGVRITSINKTNRDVLVKILNFELDKGLSEGLGIKEIAMNMQDAIKTQYAEATRMQALRIARTEIVGATCKGQVLGAQSLGYNMKKTWVSVLDNVTRDSHKSMAGKSVGLNDDFMVPASSGYDRMQHPGDARASAENVCNCRCAIAFEVL